MLNKEHRFITRTLDNPIRFLFWSIDEFVVMVVPPFVGFCTGLLSVALLGLLSKPLYSRFRKRFPVQDMKHRIFWTLPTGIFKRTKMYANLPPSHLRELIL